MSLLAKILVALLAFSGLAVVAAPPASAAGTVTVQVVGQGTVTGVGVSCGPSGGPDCSEHYADDVEQECDPERKPPCIEVRTPPTVSFEAGPGANGYQYSGFTGCDAVTEATCTLTVDGPATVRATYVDVQRPTVQLGGIPSQHVRGTLQLTATTFDNSGATGRVEFLANGGLIGVDQVAPYALMFETTSMPDGWTTLEAVAYDAAGNASLPHGRAVTIDNTAPVATVTEGPDGSAVGPGGAVTWTFDATDETSGLGSVACSVVPAGAEPSFGACTDGNRHEVTGLAEGAHRFLVRVTDRAGNTATSEERVVRVDATPPTLAVTGPSGTTHRAGTRLSWTITAEDAVFQDTDLECVLAPVGAASAVAAPCSSATGHTVPGLAHGSWRLRVTARDGVGNGTSVERTFTVDGVAPTTQITASPRKRLTTRGSKAAARFRFAASEAGGFRCQLDGAAWRACRAVTKVKARVGKHVLRVVAVDAVGNVDASPATYRWRVVRRR